MKRYGQNDAKRRPQCQQSSAICKYPYYGVWVVLQNQDLCTLSIAKGHLFTSILSLLLASLHTTVVTHYYTRF